MIQRSRSSNSLTRARQMSRGVSCHPGCQKCASRWITGSPRGWASCVASVLFPAPDDATMRTLRIGMCARVSANDVCIGESFTPPRLDIASLEPGFGLTMPVDPAGDHRWDQQVVRDRCDLLGSAPLRLELVKR